jgi:hypothetical protein
MEEQTADPCLLKPLPRGHRKPMPRQWLFESDLDFTTLDIFHSSILPEQLAAVMDVHSSQHATASHATDGTGILH